MFQIHANREKKQSKIFDAHDRDFHIEVLLSYKQDDSAAERDCMEVSLIILPKPSMCFNGFLPNQQENQEAP